MSFKKTLQNNLSYDWGIDCHPVTGVTCQCCGRPGRVLFGQVSDADGEAFAAYGARLCGRDKARVVRLTIFLYPEATDGKELPQNAAGLLLFVRDGTIATSVTTAEFPDGRGMTCEEFRASPFRDLVFAIDDFVVKKDPH